MMAKRFRQAEDGMFVFLESLITGDTSSAIMNQEKRGQDGFVSSDVLPRRCGYGCTRQDFEKMGIVFGEDADDLFVYVTLPAGWKKEATDHSMWSKLVDDKGVERASIFYKAAFYDRDAFINLTK